MSKLRHIQIELTEEQKELLRPLIEEIGAYYQGGGYGRCIIAQVMTTVTNDAFLLASILPEHMADPIRTITGADED